MNPPNGAPDHREPPEGLTLPPPREPVGLEPGIEFKVLDAKVIDNAPLAGYETFLNRQAERIGRGWVPVGYDPYARAVILCRPTRGGGSKPPRPPEQLPTTRRHDGRGD